jgi:putative glutamine amidotransferase
MNRPRVVVTSRRTDRGPRKIDYVGELHLDLLLHLRTLPVVTPVVQGVLKCLPQYMAGMCGLLLVEGEDVAPGRYDAEPANHRYLEKTDPLKDEIEIRLVRHALRHQIPILGICRGSQLLNVVCGGTLYGDVRKEKRSRLKHLDSRHYDSYRHTISVAEGTPLKQWYRRSQLDVNSYHHQGIRTLAARFRAMAHAEDGLIEAFYGPAEKFLVGLQFHPERMLKEYPGNERVWKAFAAAVHARSRRPMMSRDNAGAPSAHARLQ